MYKNIIFDLDGTLLETLDDILQALNETLDEFHLDYHYNFEEGKKLIGGGAKVLLTRALSKWTLDEETCNEFAYKYKARYLAYQGRTTHAYPFVNETLKKLEDKGIKLYIATNKPGPMTDDIVAKLLNNVTWSDIVSQNGMFPPKPNPRMVNYLIEKNNLKKEETLFVGDSFYDMLTCKNANLDSVLMLYGYETYTPEVKSYAKYTLESFDKLIDLIE